MRNALFWAALPFLLPQALYVRKTALRADPAGGPTTGSTGDGKPVRLLAIGDSIIAGVGVTALSNALVGRTAAAIASSRDCRVEWQAIGVSGYKSGDLLDHLILELPEATADYIIVSVGVNDITGLTTLPRWRKNLSQVLDELRTHSPDAVIAVNGMPPMHDFPLLPQPLRATFGERARAFDAATIDIADRRPNVVHVPIEFDPKHDSFAPDGFHPSEESYVEFGRHVANRLLG